MESAGEERKREKVKKIEGGGGSKGKLRVEG